MTPFLELNSVSFSVLNLGTWDVLLVLVSGFGSFSWAPGLRTKWQLLRLLSCFQVVFLSWVGACILGIRGLCGTMDQGFSRAWVCLNHGPRDA